MSPWVIWISKQNVCGCVYVCVCMCVSVCVCVCVCVCERESEGGVLYNLCVCQARVVFVVPEILEHCTHTHTYIHTHTFTYTPLHTHTTTHTLSLLTFSHLPYLPCPRLYL